MSHADDLQAVASQSLPNELRTAVVGGPAFPFRGGPCITNEPPPWALGEQEIVPIGFLAGGVVCGACGQSMAWARIRSPKHLERVSNPVNWMSVNWMEHRCPREVFDRCMLECAGCMARSLRLEDQLHKT